MSEGGDGGVLWSQDTTYRGGLGFSTLAMPCETRTTPTLRAAFAPRRRAAAIREASRHWLNERVPRTRPISE